MVDYVTERGNTTVRMVSFLNGSGYQEYRMFDMRGRMTKVNGKQVSYSSTSDITGITDLSVSSASQTFAYDPEHHLTDANGSYGSISYVYDSNANRTSKNVVTIPYAIGTNMVDSVVRDVAGNRISDDRFQYVYAANDRLAEVIDLVGNRVASYRHNALGQRQIKTVAGKTTWFVYGLRGELLSEVDQTTGDEIDYVYNAGERIASIRADGSVLWFHNDHLGTPMSLTDSTRTTVWSASYTPFGLATVDEDPDGDGVSVVNNLRFQGQYFDSETGLHYNYHRTYDPNLGRYTQPDLIGLLGGSNRFGYVNANPVAAVDPFGLREYGNPTEAAVMASAEAWGQIPGQYPNDPKDLTNLAMITGVTAPILGGICGAAMAITTTIIHMQTGDRDALILDALGVYGAVVGKSIGMSKDAADWLGYGVGQIGGAGERNEKQ